MFNVSSPTPAGPTPRWFTGKRRLPHEERRIRTGEAFGLRLSCLALFLGANPSLPKLKNALAYNHAIWKIQNRFQDPGTDVLPFPILPLNSIPTLYAKACY